MYLSDDVNVSYRQFAAASKQHQHDRDYGFVPRQNLLFPHLYTCNSNILTHKPGWPSSSPRKSLIIR